MNVTRDCQAPTGRQLPYHGLMLYVHWVVYQVVGYYVTRECASCAIL